MSRLFLFGILAAAIGAYLASKQGRNWLFWGLLCAIFPLAIVVLAILPPARSLAEPRRCPSCGMPNRPGDQACRHCSQPLPIDMVKCPSCGKYVPHESRCSECGGRL